MATTVPIIVIESIEPSPGSIGWRQSLPKYVESLITSVLICEGEPYPMVPSGHS